MVYVTTSSKGEAEKIAHILLEERLIACVNIIGSVSSYFHWNGKIDSTKECLMLMKTRADLFEFLESRIRILHSYDVPEVLAVPIVNGSKEYIDWLSSVLKH